MSDTERPAWLHTPEDEREVVERVQTASGELVLVRRGSHFELISNGVFLMSTHDGRSERLLVRAAFEHTTPRRVAIGGLGVGFSLAEALAHPAVEQVRVVELEEAVIRWNRAQLAPVSGNGLDDPRTEVIHADFVEWLRTTADSAPSGFDAVCIDIDNGPSWTVRDNNNLLYRPEGLELVKANVRQGGVASFWSAREEAGFSERLGRHFAWVRAYPVEVSRGEPDYIYVVGI